MKRNEIFLDEAYGFLVCDIFLKYHMLNRLTFKVGLYNMFLWLSHGSRPMTGQFHDNWLRIDLEIKENHSPVHGVSPTCWVREGCYISIILNIKPKLGPKASCGWGKGKTLSFSIIIQFKGVSFWLIRMVYSFIRACPYMCVLNLWFWCFAVDRNKRHATAATVTERGMVWIECAYFINIQTNING